MQPFVVSIRDLKRGQCLEVDYFTSAHRQALSVLSYALDRAYCVREAGEKKRVWRVT